MTLRMPSAHSYGEGQCSTCMGANHEFQLKFLLVGDSDVGKNEILDMLPSENQPIDSPLPYIAAPKETTILLEGKRVRLHLWDTSGQGRFSTIIRSYSRGAEGLLIVYDITNRWSFEGIKRWLVEIDEHAPGIPRILVGNRLHLEFKRAIPRKEVENFAAKRNMEYFEVSTLAFFNVKESLTELARLVISRNGMHRLWRCNRVPSLQELSCRSVVKQLETVHAIDRLPLPLSLKYELRSFARGAQCYTYTLPKTKKKQIRLTLSEMSARQVASRSPKNCYAESCRHERERQRAKGCVLM